MRLLHRFFTWLGRHWGIETIRVDTCCLCGNGPNKTQGVPVDLISGASAHIGCLILAGEEAQKPTEQPIVTIPPTEHWPSSWN